MSDFQYTTANSTFAQRAKLAIHQGDYEKIKTFEVEGAKPIHTEQINALPPPRFSQVGYPYNYAYRQNPAISIVDDGSGGAKLVNTTAALKLGSILVAWGEPTPEKPSSELSEPKGPVKQCIDELKKLFEMRPFWTRAALDSLVPNDSRKYIRLALPYVSYSCRSGPWRGAYGKYGIDPTSSPEYAKYQVEHYRVLTNEEFRSMRQEWEKSREDKRLKKNSKDPDQDDHLIYTFDGHKLPLSTMIALTDVTDPQLSHLMSSARIKDECDRDFGWYNSEDITLIRRVLRIKLVACKDSQEMTDKDLDDVIKEQRKQIIGGTQNRSPEGEPDESEESTKVDNEGEDTNSPSITESEVLKKLGSQVDGGSEKLKDLFGYVQQGGGDDYDGYSLMEDDDDDDDNDGEEGEDDGDGDQ